MHLRELRAALAKIVLAGLPAGCVQSSSDCYEHVDKTVEVAIPAQPSVQLLIDSCKTDVGACPNLCDEVLAQQMTGGSLTACDVRFRSDAAIVKLSYEIFTGGRDCPVSGRRADHVRAPGKIFARDLAGAWLARAAWLEAGSVHAFVRLADELASHGAPAALVRGARASALDEVRHAAVVTSFALRYGAQPPTVEVAPPQPRTLEALAKENAVEGCVRETWGAVVASWQACTAGDPEIRAAFATIARDETQHAALAWAIDRWATPLLDDAERARIADARREAVRELLDAPDATPDITLLGLPHGVHARALLARSRALWNG